MMPQHHLPADIERTSMKIITGELAQRGLDIPPENAPVVKRVIHTTADFDYAQTLHFTPGAVAAGIAAMHAGQQSSPIPTWPWQASPSRAWPSWAAGTLLYGDPLWLQRPTGGHHPRRGRHAKAAAEYPGAVLAVGNAPTALLTIAEKLKTACARRWLSVCRWAL